MFPQAFGRPYSSQAYLRADIIPDVQWIFQNVPQQVQRKQFAFMQQCLCRSEASVPGSHLQARTKMRCYALSQTQEEASAVLCALQNLPQKLEGKPQISGYLCSRHSVRISFVKHVLLDWQKQRDGKDMPCRQQKGRSIHRARSG